MVRKIKSPRTVEITSPQTVSSLETDLRRPRRRAENHTWPVAIHSHPPLILLPSSLLCVQIPMMDVVAEMMVWANASVAERISKAFPGAALLRSHPPPRGESLQMVRDLSAGGAHTGSSTHTYEVSIPMSTPGHTGHWGAHGSWVTQIVPQTGMPLAIVSVRSCFLPIMCHASAAEGCPVCCLMIRPSDA